MNNSPTNPRVLMVTPEVTYLPDRMGAWPHFIPPKRADWPMFPLL